jgi:hypothetical protein
MALGPRATVALKRGRGSTTMQTQILFLKSPQLPLACDAVNAAMARRHAQVASRDARMFWRSSQPAV